MADVKWLNVKGAAMGACVCQKTVYRAIAQGKLRVWRRNARVIFIDAASFDEWAGPSKSVHNLTSTEQDQ